MNCARPVLEMRVDGAFFQAGVIDVLKEEGVEYARLCRGAFNSAIRARCDDLPLKLAKEGI